MKFEEIGFTNGGLKGPSVFIKARNLAAAVRRQIANGAKLAPRPVRQRRLQECAACEIWKSGGNFGLGECTHKSCGCSRYKRFFLTEKCPLGKW